MEPGWALVFDSGQGGGVVPELGIGPWRTLETPLGPLPATRFRYRLIGFLNCVQVDFNLHWTATNADWTFPPMADDCHVSQPGGQPRIYIMHGASGGAAPFTRITLGAAGAVRIQTAAAGGSVGTLTSLIPRD